MSGTPTPKPSSSLMEGTPSITKKNAPQWLRSLGLQSWQAELLLSGVLLTGLFQFPAIFLEWIQTFWRDSSPMGFTFYSTITIIVLSIGDCLILMFGFHLVLRGIWIALLGLHSVYPEGIRTDHEDPAKAAQFKRAKEEYPDLAEYNLTLDRYCSLIFSAASAMAITLFSLSIFVLVCYWLFSALVSVFPTLEQYVVPIAIGGYFVFLAFSLGLEQLNRRYPDDPRLEKVNKGFQKSISVTFALYFFRRPLGYISSIYISQAKGKRLLWGIMAFSMVLGFQGARQVNDNPLQDYMGGEDYITFNNYPNRMIPYNYEDKLTGEYPIFTPLIPSDVIPQGAVVPLFIPIMEREKEAVGIYQRNFWKKLSGREISKDSINRMNLPRYVAFNQLYINNEHYEPLEFFYYIHPNRDEFGLMAYLPAFLFDEGHNLIEIRKNYYGTDGTQKIVRIPFYCSPQ